jgi:hypothetical protein
VPCLPPNAVRLQLFALAYNLANFPRTLALPGEMAQMALPRALFTAILRRIDWLRGPPVPAT